MFEQLMRNVIGDGTDAITQVINRMKPEDVDKLLEVAFTKILNNKKTTTELAETISFMLFNNEDFMKRLDEWHKKLHKKAELQISDKSAEEPPN